MKSTIEHGRANCKRMIWRDDDECINRRQTIFVFDWTTSIPSQIPQSNFFLTLWSWESAVWLSQNDELLTARHSQSNSQSKSHSKSSSLLSRGMGAPSQMPSQITGSVKVPVKFLIKCVVCLLWIPRDEWCCTHQQASQNDQEEPVKAKGGWCRLEVVRGHC